MDSPRDREPDPDDDLDRHDELDREDDGSSDSVDASGPSTKAGAGARIAVAILSLVLIFLAAVTLIAITDIGGLTPCEDVTEESQLNDEGECFDGSSDKKLMTLVLGWPGAILACISVLLALAFVVTGRGGRLLGASMIGAVALFGLSILIGSL